MQTLKEALRKRCQGYIDSRYPNWNLDAALRYLPIAEHLNRSGMNQVLDVGSGGEGLSLYWGRKTIALDLSMTAALGGSPILPVIGSATALPFRDQSIEVIVSADVLEHVPRSDRARMLSEMIRVSSAQVIVAAPCGHGAHLAEVDVERIYREKTGAPHPWLREHLAHGLPNEAEIQESIQSLAREEGRQAHIRVQKNTNLKLWRWIFRRYFGGGPRTSRFIRYYLLALIPLLRHLHWGETYRRIFFVHLQPLP
jgi:hypothetical protein